MKRYQNIWMILAVILLSALPLWIVKKPVPCMNGREAEIFTGADDKAKEIVGSISPGYKPWFRSVMEPPSGEIGSLLFALQAAAGAGFLGYWYGCSKTRAKQDKAIRKEIRC
ncbi:MAG: energy-coupling factor ABC transporter substrate-binding protein [Desulfuromonadaceae bacterium]|nr:energy-coupling factor ABC transporter substrate-binding protein [Desulfuromonadaceae bacterium]MDD2854777.1 energy-coupling factor ABC transporter substrate-binding protein [Desulfuromonadaceae bacterium]